MKRIFSIPLALLLSLSLFVPAMAYISPYRPIVTKPLQRFYLAEVGDTLTLEIGAECRKGFEGELSIEWRVNGDTLATGSKLELDIDEGMYKCFGYSPLGIFVRITNTYTDENDETQTQEMHSATYVVPYKYHIQKHFLFLHYSFVLALQDLRSRWQNRGIA